MKEKLLINAPSLPEAGIICGILDEAGIAYYTMTPGAGAAYAASINMGVKIYVSEEDYEKALEATAGCLDADVEFLDFPEGEDYGDNGEADD